MRPIGSAHRLAVRRVAVRRVAALGLGVTALGLTATTTAMTVTPANAATTSCAIQPYGLIGDYWRSVGGANSVYGCPTSDEHKYPNRNGAWREFKNGMISWSPNQGRDMLVSVYQQGGVAYLKWGSTDPFHYYTFLVRWSRDGRHIAQVNKPGEPQGNKPGRRGGTASFRLPGTGNYEFIVEGCDKPLPFGSLQCRQGWTNPVNLRYTGAPPPAPYPSPAPKIAVAYTGPASNAKFRITGSQFLANTNIRIKVVKDRCVITASIDCLVTENFFTRSNQDGKIDYSLPFSALTYHKISFSATDGRPNKADLTGELWSNIVTIPIQ
ncbi:hypothetical protein OG320_20395 [Microbispora sp. NBC_01189]|uniref:LGFP repeat-containing protein n=1 Tax=Microbispora sp. NBC_01189 TaxID=2903583 RepID=UPI002E0F8DA4|nr:hypothetical protein OG320_20395 [Microbispora sp. NBC_01189]